MPRAEPAADEIRRRWSAHLEDRDSTRRRARRRLVEAGARRGQALGRAVPAVATLFWGQRMTVWPPEIVSRTLLRDGWFEEGVTAFLLERLQPGMTYFDVGAHYGYFSLLGAAMVGPTGSVHAFEPTPSTAQTLRRNLRGHANASIVNAAVWDTPAMLELHDFGRRYSAFNSMWDTARSADHPTATSTWVPAVTLDDYVEATGATPHVVKVDAESAELQVLRGMETTLVRHRPDVLLEVGDVGVQGATASRVLVDHLLARGYEAREHRQGQLVAHEPLETYTYGNLLFVPA